MPHAVIRRESGSRQEANFGDASVSVEIHASEETVEIFIEVDCERPRSSVGASLFSTFPVTCSAKQAPRRRDVPGTSSYIPGAGNDVGAS
jgi:hypothetical protein